MERIITFDLHTHLNEKRVKAKKYWEMVVARGLDAVAITEHANLRPELAYERVAESKPKNILLIPGMELNTSIGHVVAYGNDKNIYSVKKLFEKKLDIHEAIDLAKSNEIMLSIAHPWGISYDSAAFLYGEKNLHELVKKKNIGVEIYNGMIGNLSNFIYDTNWIRKPINFFEFIERNRIARKTRLSKIGAKIKNSLNKKSEEVLKRCGKAIELGTHASFVTAGSDSHYPNRIGAGIIKMKWDKKNLNMQNIFEGLGKKEKIVWFGPYVREVAPGEFEKIEDPLTRKEMIEGLGYASKKFIIEKTRLRKKMKKLKKNAGLED